MHKKINKNYYLTYDIHIVDALKSLEVPLITFDNHKVYFDEDKRNETIFEHIANKKHHLHIVDIIRVPIILKDQNSLQIDRNGPSFRTYIGERGKKTEKPPNLKIITKIKPNNKESVVNIYLDKN